MRTFRFIGFTLFAILLCLSACSSGGDDPIEPTPKPEVTKSEITIDSSIISNGLSFSNVAGDQSISFTTNGNWTLSVASTTSGATWCTASVTSGTKGSATVKFTVTENTEYENRSVSVTIKCGTASKTFTITQKSADALLVTTNKYEIAQEGGTIEIEVKANIDYKMEISEKAKEWIKESSSRALKAYKHKLDIAMNEDVGKREGEITFKSGDKVETVKVYQAGGAIILLSQDEYSVSDAGETISVEIKSNVEFGVQMPDVDWITDEASSRGMSSHTLKYAVAPNEGYDSRSAEIIFYDKNSDLKDTLKISQAQKDAIILSGKYLKISSNSDTIEVKLSANVEFEIEMPEVDWIKQVSSRALSDHTIKFFVSANEGTKSRNANILFTNKEKEVNETLVITQQSNYGCFEFRNSNHSVGFVELYQAGTLEKTLESVTEPLIDIKILSVAGPINGDDIYFLRKILNGNYPMPHLEELNLSKASIVEGGSKDKCYTYDNEIGYSMFAHLSNLGSITLPDNAISIGKIAFYNCPNLAYVFMGDKLASIGESAFLDCDKLWRVSIGKGVTSIGKYCFRSCVDLSTIVIPDNVTSIGKGAFYECHDLKSVTIGNGVTYIDESTFYNCKALNSITIGENVTYIGYYAFQGCSSLTSIDIPDGVTQISSYAFEYCSSLESIAVPDNVTSIGDDAFHGCSSLKSITLGNNLKSIKEGAFSGCSSLESIVIPNNVTSIKKNAFFNCSSMNSITIGDGLSTIEEDVFKGCKALGSVYITDLSAWCNIDFKGASTADDYKAYCNPLFNHAKLYLNNKEITELVIPGDITKIMSNTFYGCSSISSVTIGKNVTEIGWHAFNDCPSLSSVTIGDGVTEIGLAAFSDCFSLSKVSFGKHVSKIEKRAFKNASIMECYSYNSTPPYIFGTAEGKPSYYSQNTFYNAIEVGAVLYIPKGSFAKYWDSNWDGYFYYYDKYNQKYGNIREMD